MPPSPPEPVTMSGATALVRAMAAGGVDVCFANPGTTEMPLVRALDEVTAVRPVLGLFEGVCTGAADGFARVSDRPASTLLHLGPGFANGIANLHNARRAWSPMLNIVGDHASWHVQYDPALTSDIHSLARPVSGWVRTSTAADNLAADTSAALAATRAFPRLPSTLVVPVDFQQAQVGYVDPPERPSAGRLPVSGEHIAACARRVREARHVVVLLGADALGERGQAAVARIAYKTDATVYSETFPAKADRGAGLPELDRLPYFPEVARRALADADVVLLAGALEPVAYFGYEGIPSLLAPEGSTLVLGGPGSDNAAALEDLADELGADQAPATPTDTPAAPEHGQLTPTAVGAVVAAHLPEGALVSVEGGTCGYPFFTASGTAARHTTLTNTGGAIGQGLPVALGAAIAAPDRRVIALQSDGSAQYTIQALWTMAREQLPVTILIAANSRYGVLQTELDRLGSAAYGAASSELTSLASPTIDWMSLAGGYGVPASTVEDVEQLRQAMQRAVGSEGPLLIEMKL